MGIFTSSAPEVVRAPGREPIWNEFPSPRTERQSLRLLGVVQMRSGQTRCSQTTLQGVSLSSETGRILQPPPARLTGNSPLQVSKQHWSPSGVGQGERQIPNSVKLARALCAVLMHWWSIIHKLVLCWEVLRGSSAYCQARNAPCLSHWVLMAPAGWRALLQLSHLL